MEIFIEYAKAFIVGGLLCLIGQLLIDFTKLTPARILVSYVVAGVILGAIGWYKPLIDFAGAGATVPLTGFGYLLSKGVYQAVSEDGLLGALTGGLQTTELNKCKKNRISTKYGVLHQSSPSLRALFISRFLIRLPRIAKPPPSIITIIA